MSRLIHIDRRTARRLGVSQPRAVVAALLAMSRSRMAVLKDDPARSVVYQVQHAGRAWVLKVYRHQSRLKMLLRGSPAWRELRLARSAARVPDLRVNVPLALATLTRREQALVLPYVEGQPMHEMVTGCTDAALRLKLAAGVGRQMRALLDAGLINRDQKLSNLIADARCVEHGDMPVMIDPLGLRVRRKEAQVLRMWATLLRTTLREGPISVREGLTCLKTATGSTRQARDILAAVRGADGESA